MFIPDHEMKNEEIFSGEKIGELTEFIINKFSEEKLSYEKAMVVVKNVEDMIGSYTEIKHVPKDF